jgi:thiol:disulfide interchange protein DsbD
MTCHSVTFDTHVKQKNPQKQQIQVAYQLAPDEIIINDSVTFSVSEPALEVADWKSTKKPISFFHEKAQKNRTGLNSDGTFIVDITQKKDREQHHDAELFMHYTTNQYNQPQEYRFHIPTDRLDKQQSMQEKTVNDSQQSKASSPQTQSVQARVKDAWTSTTKTVSTYAQTFEQWLKNVVKKSDSYAIRMMLVYLLGLLMSLTPCIYPMMPIAVGILQTTAQKSLFMNFLMALAYTVGIASTFATLGLLAATGSTQFGALLGNPIFVCILIAFLSYIGFSMLGFYEMYIPRFLQGGQNQNVNGSWISAFLFGAMSGTVASPCLSPGLLFLLGIVATLGSKIMGFLLLFTFGAGVGTPLLILGTFSGMMQNLPRAGMWMLEVKKFFGLLLISMCFYYLSNIIPWPLTLALVSLFFIATGLYYMFNVGTKKSTAFNGYIIVTSIVFIIIGLVTGFQSYKYTMAKEPATTTTLLHLPYQEAIKQAQTENKVLLLDFGASWCTSCTEVENQLLRDPYIVQKLRDVLLVKIDCTNPHAPHCASVQKEFNIIGFPAVLLIDPETETVMKRWGSELLNMSADEFIDEINTRV